MTTTSRSSGPSTPTRRLRPGSGASVGGARSGGAGGAGVRRPERARRVEVRTVVGRPRSSVADPRRRLIALLALVTVAFAAVIGRLAFVQGFSAQRYAALGRSQRLHTVVLPATRGAIFDRNGVQLAMTVSQKTVWANPQLVRDPAAEAHALAGAIPGTDENALRLRLSSPGAFVYVARKVDDATASQVASLRLAGISFIDEPKRFDPAGSLAAPLLGTVGLDNEGLSGLEIQYEHQLTGQPGQLVVEQDPHGTPITSGVHEYRPAVRGEDLVLTIDRSMQYETERALAAQVVSSNAKGGIAIVMDPRSGEVLAMANVKASDNGQPPGPAANNLAITNVYEPGSVNKVITIAGALEEGVIHPSDTLVVPDHMMVADGSFGDAEPHPTEPLSITDIVANSSNIGTIMIGQKLGKMRIDRYLRAFGLGRYTGSGFPGESPGLLLSPKDWSGTSYGSVPIGQGLAVTALQMLDVYDTIANGGNFVPPRVVKAIVDQRGRTHELAPKPSRRVVSSATAHEVTAMLTEVVRAGTAQAAQIDGYTVAGKTGTARKPLEGARGYKQGAYMATFAGFVPAEAPHLSAIVVLDEPTPIYGGLVSAPVFADLARYGLRLFDVPPPIVSPSAREGSTAGGGGAGAVPRLSPSGARGDGDVGGLAPGAASLVPGASAARSGSAATASQPGPAASQPGGVPSTGSATGPGRSPPQTSAPSSTTPGGRTTRLTPTSKP
ncbi:MAG: peptidoglycan D,D-transpeptidase FtsI family protein [Acidimicrobiales bacterium]